MDNLESLRPALAELERYVEWADEEFGLKPEQPVVITIQTVGKRAAFGVFHRKKWSTKEGGAVHEILIAAEHLKRPPVEVLGTLHHELLHLFAEQRKIKDCSQSGRHNKLFKELAESYGLVVAEPTDRHGWAHTSYAPDTQKRVEKEFKPDFTAFKLFRLITLPKPGKTKMKKWTCGCPTNVRCAVELDAVCNKCSQPFQQEYT